MATFYNDLPGVRRKEVDLSQVSFPRVGNTVGMVVASPKGRIKRPYTITSRADYVNGFGAPDMKTSATLVNGTGKNTGIPAVYVPSYGYGSHAAMYVLNETTSLVVARGFSTEDTYATVGIKTLAAAGLTGYTSAFGVNYDTSTSGGVSATAYNEGDTYDTDTYISSLDSGLYTPSISTPGEIHFGFTSPTTDGNRYAVTIEYPSSASSWIYSFDGYPSGIADVSAIFAGTSAASTWLPIGSKVVKISVYERPENKSWSEMYVNNADKIASGSNINSASNITNAVTGGWLRIAPVETFLCTLDHQRDTNNSDLFIENVINGNSQFVYAKVNPFTSIQNQTLFLSGALDSASNQTVLPYGIDDNGVEYLRYNSLMPLAGGGYTLSAYDEADVVSSWDIFRNRKEVTVDLLLCPDSSKASKQRVAAVVADRLDCFAELQSHPADKVKIEDIIKNETYGYQAPSYVALNVGFSRVFDGVNNQDIYLPNAILAAVADLRTLRLYSPWDAPAGINRGILPVDEQLKRYTDAELDKLIGKNLNPVSFERGYGFCLWSQRTAQLKKSALDRKNVRFNLLYIENNIEQSLKQFVFENNTSQTRLRISSMVEGFLNAIKSSGGLYAYAVKCDESNNGPDVIDTNQLNVTIGVQPAKTAEYINFTTIVTRTGVSFSSVGL